MPGIYAPSVAAPSVAVEAPAFGLRTLAQPKPAASTATAALGLQDESSTSLAGKGLIGGLSAAVAVRAALRRKRSRSQWLTARQGDAGQKMVLCKSPAETYQALVEKGVANSGMSALKTLHATIMGGCYVGLAGLLSLCIAGNMGAAPTMSAQKFVFAALFPVNLLLVLQSGGQLFTGNTMTMAMAWFEKKIKFTALLRSWVIAWIGNVIGCLTIAFIADYTHILTAGTQELAIATVLKKTGSAFLPTFVKGIMCNWLVCMAVYLSTQANDLTGKMTGIWFPISMFVAIGFEHSVANMFLLPAGLLSGACWPTTGVPLTVLDIITKNLIPVSLGNAFAGAIVMAAGQSFSFGRLGMTKKEKEAADAQKEMVMA